MDESGEVYQSRAAGLKIYRRVFAPDSGRIRGGALLLHGLGDHIGCHLPAAELCCRRDLLSLGIDWPGNGLSGGKRGDIESVAVAAALIAEARSHLDSLLPPGSPVGIYGHSTGGFFALEYLTQQGLVPDSTLLNWVWLSSPLLRPDHRQHPLKRKMAPLAAKLAPRLLFDTGVRPERCHHIDDRRPNPENGSGLCHHLISARLGADLLAHAGKINEKAAAIRDPMRLLITQGADDTICPPEFSRDFFERAPARDKTFALFPGMLHEPLREPDNSPAVEAVGKWFDAAPRRT